MRVRCGGVPVDPGDLVVGDADGRSLFGMSNYHAHARSVEEHAHRRLLLRPPE